MKKFISAAICAAMILSMAVTYSADSFTLSRSVIQPYSSMINRDKEVKPLYTVSEPKIPEDIDEQYTYQQQNQTPEAFIQSLQTFGAKTSSMLLKDTTSNQTYSPVSFAYALGIGGLVVDGDLNVTVREATGGLGQLAGGTGVDAQGILNHIGNGLHLGDTSLSQTFFRSSSTRVGETDSSS